MKVARLQGIRRIEIDEAPVPEPGPGEARVRITRVGVCGSDVHYYRHMRIGNAVCPPGHISGHEPAGVIDGFGPDVDEVRGRKGLDVGSRVAVEPDVNCAKCRWCETGFPNQCPHMMFISSPPYPGAFSEYISHPVRCLYAVPDSIPGPSGDEPLTDSDAAILEPLGVGIHAVRRARVGAGETVAVFGSGPIGLSTMACARAAGASRVFATDILGYRLEFARKYGAEEVMDASGRGDVGEWVKGLTGGRGADCVFECSGAQSAVDDCVHAVRIGGRVGLVGSPEGDRLSYEAHYTRRKELDMLNVRRSRFRYETAIPMALAGQTDLRTMVTHTFPLDEIARAFDLADRYADGLVKAVIAVSEP
jgi:L-iditol 2-dehydrogenase